MIILVESLQTIHNSVAKRGGQALDAGDYLNSDYLAALHNILTKYQHRPH